MLIFVFLVATLNLGVGYVLGQGLGPRDLMDQAFALLPARKKKPLDEDLEDEPLSRPAPSVEAAEPKQDPQDVLASLANVRNELNAASSDVKAEAKPADANAAEEPPASQAESEEEAAETPSDEEVQEDSATAEQAVTDDADQATEQPSDVSDGTDAAEPVAPSSTIDELFDRLEASLAEADDDAICYVAKVRVDPIEGQEEDSSLGDAVVDEVARAAAELLTEAQTFVSGSPAMILLEGDSFDEAKGRLDGFRKRVEEASFTVGDSDTKATVTCAFADARSGDSREQVLEQLSLALEESTRSGTNRVYHHDGAFPTAVDEGSPNESVEAEEPAAEPVA